MSGNELDVALVIRGRNETGSLFAALNEALTKMAAAMLAAGAAAATMAAMAGKEFAVFEQGLLNVRAASDGTAEDFRKFKEAALEASAASRFAPTDTVAALYDLSSAGLSSASAIKALNPTVTLAAASNASLARSSENLVMVMGLFGLGAEKAGAIADTMTASISATTMDANRMSIALRNSGATANAMGQSFETTIATLGLLTNSFMSGEASGTGLKSLFGELNQKGKTLGIEMKDTSGKMKSLPDIIDDMARAGWDAGRAVQEFGADAGPTLAILLTQGADAIRDMEQKVQANGQAARAAAIQNDGLQAALDKLSNAFTVLKLKMGEAVAPGEKLAARQLAWFLQLPGVVSAAEALGAAVGKMGQYVTPILYTIAEAGYWVYGRLAMIGNLPGVQKLGQVFSWLADTIGAAFRQIMTESSQTWGVLDTAAGILGVIVSEASELIADLVIGMIGLGSQSKDSAASLSGAFSGIAGAVREMWAWVYGVFTQISGVLRANGVTAQSTGQAIGAAFRWIAQAAGELWKEGDKALDGLGKAARENGVTIRSVTQGIVDAIKWVISALSGDNEQVSGWINTVMSAFDVVRGAAGIAWAGIKDGLGYVWQEIQKIFGGMKTEFLAAAGTANTLSLEQLINQLKSVKAEDIADWIKKQFGKIVEEVKATYEEWKKSAEDFKKGYQDIKDALGKFSDWVGEMSPLFKVLKDLAFVVGFLVAAFLTGLNQMVIWGNDFDEKIAKVFESVKKTFTGLTPAFQSVKDGLSSIKDGIVNMFDDLSKKISSIVSGIVSAWKSVTGGGSGGSGGGASANPTDDGWRDPFGGTNEFFRTPAFGGWQMPVYGYSDADAAYYDQGYATGTSYIPRDGLYRLHQGERVVSNSSTSFGDFNFNLGSGHSTITEADWRRIVRAVIAPELVRMGWR